MVTLFDNETILKGYTKAAFKEGERKNAVETAEKMLREALPIDLIVRISGLSAAEIDTIKAQMAN